MSGATALTATQAENAELAVFRPSSNHLDSKAIVTQVAIIQSVMKAVMKPGVHYGVIPGTKSRSGNGNEGDERSLNSLFKAGSEVLLTTFRIAVRPEVLVERDGDHNTYRVSCVGTHIITGAVVGTGIGEASTAEEKYAWRAAVCPEEFDATPESHRRVKWYKGNWDSRKREKVPPRSVQQVRTNPADMANTVLKMAKKRAQIDLCLTALAASDCFTQDLEDMPEEILDSLIGEYAAGGNQADAPNEPPKTAAPRAQKSGQQAGQGGPCTPGQARMIRTKLSLAGLQESALKAQFGVNSADDVPISKVNDVLSWLKEKQ